LTQNKNIKILVNYCLGPLLFAWFSWAIYQQLKSQSHLRDTLHDLQEAISGSGAWKLWAVLMLVPVNWGIESRKWQLLLAPVESISLFNAFKAVLAGLAFSMNTPNRVGEYGGRVVFVHEGHRWKAFSLTIVGSFSQIIVTFVMGLAGLFFMLHNPLTLAGIASYQIWVEVFFYGCVVVAVGFILLYFRLGAILKWVEKIPKTQKFLQHLAVIESLPVTVLLRTLSLSVARYIIFVFQYILLLQLFAVELPGWHFFWLITVLYLVLAVTPTIALAELGFRGQLSLLLFTLVSNNKFGIVGAATAIWLVNLVIPALAGSMVFVGLKIYADK
ncbi:MAG TPA: lysylphosphatidylglycerol synthase domain-containing protein, partial [Mucilaginibacter sp.]|nr:lysylphosphatidylglycerol synthase domain-containing protein [Mucilaginibacter sp.]